MSRPDGHHLFEELSAGHALHALEPQDEQHLEAHLPSCAQCRRQLVADGELLGELALLSPPVEPPATLLASIRAEILALSPDAFAKARPATRSAARLPAGLLFGHARQRSRTEGAPAPALARRARWAGVAAGVALVGSVLGSIALGNPDLLRGDRGREVATEQLAQVVQSLKGSSGRTVALAPDGGGAPGSGAPDGGGAARAVAVLDGDLVSLVVDGLPVNDAGASSYVLWGRGRSGSLRGLTTFDVGPGAAQVVSRKVALGEPADGFAGFAITLERGDVAPPVTTQPVLLAGTLPG